MKELKKIKQPILYYFIYDFHLSITVIFLSTLSQNLFFNVIVLGLGPLSFLFQCYQIFNLINVFTQTEHKIDFFEYWLLFFGFSVSCFRLIYTVYENIGAHSTQVHIVDIFRESKLLFFCVFFAFIIFQLYFVFPSLVRLFFFIYHYPVKKSFLQIGLYLFFLTLVIKTALDYFQLNILQFFKIVNIEDEQIAHLIRIQSDQFLSVISIFSFFIYLAVFYFVRQSQKILSEEYQFLKVAEGDSVYVFINSKHSIEMSVEGRSFQDFILAVGLENIQRRFSFQGEEVSFIFFRKEDDEGLFLYFNDPECLIYREIIKKKMLVYDHYYDYAYIVSLDTAENNLEHEEQQKMLHYFQESNTRVLVPFILENKIIGFIKIHLSTLASKSLFLEEELVFLYQLSQYIAMTLHKVHSDPFYRKLEYKNKIAESNLEENNNLFKKFYDHLNQKIRDISQILVLEDRKETLLLYGLRDTYKKDMQLNDFLKVIHRNIPMKELQDIHENFFVSDPNTHDFSIFSTGKIKLGKYKVSLHTFLPFIKKKNNFFAISILNKKIDTLFPEFLSVFYNERTFFFQFDLNYTIKIVIAPDNTYQSFFKIIDYISDVPCVLVSLKNIFLNEKKIFDYIKQLLGSGKPYHVFFVDIDQNVYETQYTILDIYSNYVVLTDKVLVKFFFFVGHENELKNIHYKIIQISSSLLYKSSPLSEISPQNAFELLKNYTFCILKKYYSEENIQKFIEENYFFLQQNSSLYSFFDSFEKMIHAYRFKNISSSYSKDFYVKEGARLGKESFRNSILMDELLSIYEGNYSSVATLLGVHKSSVSRYFKKRSLTTD